MKNKKEKQLMNTMIYGMYKSFTSGKETENVSDIFDQILSMMNQSDWDENNNYRFPGDITEIGFPYLPNLTNLNFDISRNLDFNTVLNLAKCDFVINKENILITGCSGSGKTYLSIALAYQASICKLHFKIGYYISSNLFEKLSRAKNDGSYETQISRLQNQDVLIFDDFDLKGMDSNAHTMLLDILKARENMLYGSIIITSMTPVHVWYDLIGNKLIDTILDKLIHQAHRLDYYKPQ